MRSPSLSEAGPDGHMRFPTAAHIVHLYKQTTEAIFEWLSCTQPNVDCKNANRREKQL